VHRAPAPSRRRGHQTGPRERQAIVAVAVLAGAVAAFSSAQPTTFIVSDVLIRGAVAMVVTLATSRARRWTWLVLAGLAVVGAPAGPWFAVCAAGAVFCVATTFSARRRIYGAIVGACAIQGLLRLDDVGFSRASAVLFVIAVAPVLASAYAVSPRRVRRRVHRTLLVLVGVGAFSTLLFLVSIALAYDATQEAAAKTTSGLEQARDGAGLLAAGELNEASEAFRTAHDRVDGWWAKPLGAVPFIAQQLHAIEVVTEEGAAVADAAASVAADADIQDLRYEDGQIDVEELASLADPLSAAAATFETATERVGAVRSPWLLPPLADRVDLAHGELEKAMPDVQLAAMAAREGPALLGADGPRHYLVLFTQPAEARGLGGFVGNWAELRAVDGRVDVERSGRANELNRTPGRDERMVTAPAPPEGVTPNASDLRLTDYVSRYGRYRPGYYFQDITLSPDLPTVADVAAQLYPQMGGDELDGVLVVDPYALAALLEFTGPIEIDDFPVRLTSENAASILVRDQYVEFSSGGLDVEGERVDFLDQASERTFDELVHGSLPSPRKVAEVLSPVVQEGRLAFHPFDADERALFERVGADGSFADPEGADFFQLVTQNKGNNKIDVFLHRSVTYETTYNPSTGGVEATATIILRNDAPSEGLPDVVIGNNDQGLPFGTNVAYVSFYTPFGLRGAQLGDEQVPLEYQRELGQAVYSTYVEIPPGQERTLRLDLFGQIETGSSYRLDIGAQPLVNADEVRVRLKVEGGWEIARSRTLRPDDTGVAATTLVDLDARTTLGADLVQP
jgi:hypothetical protein